ncbi:MAG: endonuclease III [Rhodobiaceae bacterium]|nr:endonuclease III [Rhodobiaceae bacterium]
MNKSKRINIISRILDEQYKETPAPLDHSDPFTLLIAVLLSAQCTDERVNKVTPLLFEKASDPEEMRKLSEKKIYGIIRPCGLGPQKSKAIKKLSDILVRDYEGRVPSGLIELEKLPGVGHKTASVVVSQAFNKPAFPVDTHIHRLAQRWGLTNGKNVKQTEKDLKRLFPKKDWQKLHLQIIFWGREYCQARECWGLECRICSTCYPKRKRKFKHKKP